MFSPRLMEGDEPSSPCQAFIESEKLTPRLHWGEGSPSLQPRPSKAPPGYPLPPLRGSAPDPMPVSINSGGDCINGSGIAGNIYNPCLRVVSIPDFH